MSEEAKQERVGMWWETSKNGKKYLKGKRDNGERVTLFPNETKKTEKSPDANLLIGDNPNFKPVAAVAGTVAVPVEETDVPF